MILANLLAWSAALALAFLLAGMAAQALAVLLTPFGSSAGVAAPVLAYRWL